MRKGSGAKPRLRVLTVAAEASPYAKVGGLGDVAGTLPVALAALGIEMAVVLPLYREVALQGHAPSDTGVRVRIDHGGLPRTASVREARRGRAAYWFLDEPSFFDRDGIYGPPGGEYADSVERFSFLARGALAAAEGMGFAPDIVHCHDWHAALVPVYLKAAAGGGRHGPACVLTIHNLAYQGWYAKRALDPLGLPQSALDDGTMEFEGRMNFLKAGVVTADAVTTVSPTYAREILTPEAGCGLDAVLRGIASPVAGLLNGIDEGSWDPSRDPSLAARYGAGDLGRRGENRNALRGELKLYPDPASPLFAFVGRLVHQKGIDLLARAVPRLVERGCQVAVLGSGDPSLEDTLRSVARSHPGRVSVTIGFEEVLGRRLYAGADFFVMPSRFEPCGLGQMIAMRYGAIPVVRATGGLADTVTDLRRDPEAGTGFVFGRFEDGEFAAALEAAHALYRSRGTDPVRRRIMSVDNSWGRTAAAYLDLYRRTVESRRKGD